MKEYSSMSMCKLCGGICCYRFMLNVKLNADNTVNWDASLGKDENPEDVAFMKSNFVQVRPRTGEYIKHWYPEDYNEAPYSVPFTCKALRNGRCTAYENRPYLCRAHICIGDPWLRGVPPVLDVVRIGKFVHRRLQWVGLTAIENGEQQFTELGEIKRVTGSTAIAMPTDYGRQYRTLVKALKAAGITDTPKQWAKRLKEKRRRARRKQRWESVKTRVRAADELKE